MIYKLELEVGSKTECPEDFLELVEEIKKIVKKQKFQLNYAVPLEKAKKCPGTIYSDKWNRVKS